MDEFYSCERTERRYVIIDADTGEVFDDAQGYGYKTKQKAYAAYNYKNRPKDAFKQDEETRRRVQEYCRTHKSVVDNIGAFMLDELKCGNKLTAEQLSDFLSEEVRAEMGFSVKDLLKYW